MSYNVLFHLTGMARKGVGGPLGHIAAYCHQNDLPLLNIIAISETTGKAEAEFLLAVDLLTEQARVFVYDWIAHGAPDAEKLEQAYATAKATGKFRLAGAWAQFSSRSLTAPKHLFCYGCFLFEADSKNQADSARQLAAL